MIVSAKPVSIPLHEHERNLIAMFFWIVGQDLFNGTLSHSDINNYQGLDINHQLYFFVIGHFYLNPVNFTLIGHVACEYHAFH